MSYVTLPPIILTGKGQHTAPAAVVPGVEAGDCNRDPVADYETADTLGKAWIRRCINAENFAKALEAELNKLRQK